MAVVCILVLNRPIHILSVYILFDVIISLSSFLIASRIELANMVRFDHISSDSSCRLSSLGVLVYVIFDNILHYLRLDCQSR